MMPFQKEIGEHPTMEDMQLLVVHNKIRPNLDPIWYQNEDLADLCRTIEECWDQDPDARLTAECIYERFNQTSKYLLSSLDDSAYTLPLPLQSKDQSSTSSFSVDDSSSVV